MSKRILTGKHTTRISSNQKNNFSKIRYYGNKTQANILFAVIIADDNRFERL